MCQITLLYTSRSTRTRCELCSRLTIKAPECKFKVSNKDIRTMPSVLRFARKLPLIVSRRCWFLFQHYFSEFPTLNPLLGKFEPKKSKLSILSKNWHTEYLEDSDFYSDISFLNFQTQIHFWVELGPESGIGCFVWCSCTSYLEDTDLLYLKFVNG